MIIKENFLSVDEEQSLLEEVEPYMKKLRYEFDHWDDAIHGYRETERLEWNEANKKILNRVKDCAFDHFEDTKNTNLLAHVHILDLHENGYIKPHVDAVRFCGNTIAGLSLLSDAVMKLTHEKEKHKCASVLLKRRSLYIMRYYINFVFTFLL
jgi:alkylated DNA repair protein alkB family protein 7